MAEYIPNQPVFFGEDIACSKDEIEYIQIVDNADTTQFQFAIDKCDGAIDKVVNGDFNSSIAGWSVDGAWYNSNGKMCVDASISSVNRYAQQTGIIAAGKYYVVEIEVSGITGGFAEVFLGENIVGTIYSPGSYKFFGLCYVSDPLMAVNFAILLQLPGTAICIESVHVYEIRREFIVAVYDKTGQFAGEISFSQNPDMFVFYKDTVTVSLQWQDLNLQDNCYYLCLIDPCANSLGQSYPAKIKNCSFATNEFWGFPGWSFGVGYVSITMTAVGTEYPVTQSGVFDRFDVDYYVNIDAEVTGGGKIDVYFGTNLLQTINSTGTYNVIGKAAGSGVLRLVASTTANPGTAKINSACPASVIYGNAEIINCSFDQDGVGWGGNWEFASGQAFADLTSDPTRTLIQEDVFGDFNKEYGISLRATISPFTDAEVRVYFGTKLVKTITTTGDHQIFDYPEGNNDLRIEAELITGSTGVAGLNYICPIIRSSQYECNFVSNYFKLGVFNQPCNMLINACNNEDGMGFVFGPSGFTPRIRINARLVQAKYDAEKNIYEDSLGKKSIVNYRRRKSKYLATGILPEYIHDFLSTLVGYDNVYLDGELYVCDDTEYNVEYGDLEHHGSAKILFSEKTQGVVNTNCTDAEINCKLAESYLLRADDPSSFVTQTDGSLIKING